MDIDAPINANFSELMRQRSNAQGKRPAEVAFDETDAAECGLCDAGGESD